MKKVAARMVAILALLAIGVGGFVYAQQHDHSQHQNQANTVSADDDVAIFCPTMKTGQLCSHGTANVLQLSGKKQEQWIEIARKYDKAVDAATLQLFKDSEGVLTPEQMKLLKAWFAVGLNPEINQLLYSKGLGPKKP
ncbi:MAG TPA: hypothetical protein VE422_32080 [Terriglobia bacterium]|nr:hypothetical protein [Terriglobia bacterium]